MNSESDKIHKKNLAEQQKRIRPGECLKYITTVIDPVVINTKYGSQIVQNLNQLGVKSIILRNTNGPNLISWSRLVQQSLVQQSGQLVLDEKCVDEDHMLLIMLAPVLVSLIQRNTLQNHIQDLQRNLTDKQVTLVICGLGEYLNGNRSISRPNVERALTRLQVFAGTSHRLIDSAADLALTVVQFTKSVAEILYKKQQSDKMANENVYFVNDNKDCVAVKGSLGLSRLWQHHLIKLPLATLETAEAIIGEYPMPRLLLNEYETCSDGADLLTNIPVRRAGGPLTTVRKIGPEMSRRVHDLYTKDDPNIIL